MSRELDEQCARALGYSTLWAEDSVFGPSLYLHDAGAVRESNSVTANCHLLGANWERLRVDGDIGEFYVRLCPAFSESHEAARILEDEIERRGLAREYARTLLLICTPIGGMNGDEELYYWRLIRATPEQKVRAFLVEETHAA